tara:strand:+ start:812 stop:1018 length:207 start_codon:yes stop_codon:yes gene_type:complete
MNTIYLDDLHEYPLVTAPVRHLNQERYYFITGDQEDPASRVIEVTFFEDAKSIEFHDVTDLYREKYQL